jgi:hypothetical protein
MSDQATREHTRPDYAALDFERLDAPALRAAYERDGLLPYSFELGDPGVVEELRRDIPMYRMEIARMRAQGLYRVPYLLTQSILTAMYDPHILAVVQAVLGTDELVMWGANLQVGTPNEAGLWHTDIESWLWPTVTVVVGLKGCRPENSTVCVPGSHRLPCQPWAAADNSSADAVLGAARALSPACTHIADFADFGDNRFYLFDAKCWHTGKEGASAGRELLFLHYDRAANPRIPYMDDYEDRTWFDFPASYVKVANGREFEVNQELYSVAGKEYRGVPTPV